MGVKLREIGSNDNNYQKFTKYRNFLKMYTDIENDVKVWEYV